MRACVRARFASEPRVAVSFELRRREWTRRMLSVPGAGCDCAADIFTLLQFVFTGRNLTGSRARV